MNVSKLMTVLALPLCLSGAAWAGDASSADKSPAAPTHAAMSRAEVLADLQIWRESGMAELNSGEVGLAYTPAYEAAAARYEALHAAPSFAALVQRIAQRMGGKVMVAAAS